MRALLVPLVLLSLAQGSRPADVPFKIQPIDPGASETAAVADVNRDGRLDIISGEHWYQAPAWTKHRFRELGFSNQYIDDFSDLVIDVDADGYPDVVSVSWFAKQVAWWRNPGQGGLKRARLEGRADPYRLQRRVRGHRRSRQRRQGAGNPRAGERHRPGLV